MRVGTAVLAAVIALVLAGCGDDEDSTTGVDVEEVPTRTLSPKQEIEQVGNEWAPLFAKDVSAACRYMFGQPLCEEFFGRVGEPPEVRRPSGFQQSFANATVERVEIKGHKAGAEFSNGELVEFIQETGGPAPSTTVGPDWFIYDVGGKLAADNKDCGAYSRWRLAVVEGGISCRMARRVVHGLEYQRVPDGWRCTGGDQPVLCVTEAGERIRAPVRKAVLRRWRAAEAK